MWRRQLPKTPSSSWTSGRRDGAQRWHTVVCLVVQSHQPSSVSSVDLDIGLIRDSLSSVPSLSSCSVDNLHLRFGTGFYAGCVSRQPLPRTFIQAWSQREKDIDRLPTGPYVRVKCFANGHIGMQREKTCVKILSSLSSHTHTHGCEMIDHD